jgi:hypothetical protein
MYDRLLKLLETQKDDWKKASREPGDRVPADQIRGNRSAPGMMGGMRATLHQQSTGLPRSIERQRKTGSGASMQDIHAGRRRKKS